MVGRLKDCVSHWHLSNEKGMTQASLGATRGGGLIRREAAGSQQRGGRGITLGEGREGDHRGGTGRGEREIGGMEGTTKGSIGIQFEGREAEDRRGEVARHMRGQREGT